VRLLLQHGADADAKDFASGKTALKMAEQHGHQDAIISPLYLAYISPISP